MSFFDKPWVRVSVSTLIGFIFLFAAFSKLGHPQAFQLSLQHYPFVPRGSEPFITYGLAMAEALVGLGLFMGQFFAFFRRIALVLLGLFIASLVTSLFGQIRVECGCFGPLFSPQPEWMVFQDAIFFVLLVLIGPKPLRPHSRHLVYLFGLVWFIACVALARVSPWMDPVFVKLRPGYPMKTLPSLDVAATNHGKPRIVVLTDSELPREDMQSLALAFPTYEPVLVSVGATAVQAGPEWTIVQAKPQLIPFLARHLPTVFMIHDDKVDYVWYGKVPRND